VADVFDALSTKRAYKPAFPLDKCFAILEEGRGTHFDPRVLEAFLTTRDEILQVQIMFAEVT
jgi:putative two-component system response regulator